MIPPGQSVELYEALREAGTEVSLTLVTGSGHLVQALPPGAPAHRFDLGAPIIGASDHVSTRASAGIQHHGDGLAPEWDAIDAFLSSALDDGD